MTTPVPIDQPHYGISFGGAIARFYRKYATFSGRASRSEYWWVQLMWLLSWVPLIVAFVIDRSQGHTSEPGPVFGIVAVLWSMK